MRPLSATECITPAIERTKALLFKPFRVGRTWKLCMTAYVCRAGMIFFPCPLVYLFFLPWARSAGTTAVTLLIVGTLGVTAIACVLFYLCSRLQFSFFDIVVNRGEFVAPAWRKYGSSSRLWTGLKILFGTLATLACAAPIVAYIHHIIPLFQALKDLKPGQPPPMQFIAAFYGGYALLVLLIGGLYVVTSLVSDFVIPSLALEDTSLKEAFRRMVELIRHEPGEFAIYVLLRLGLGFAAYMGVLVAWEIVIVLCSLLLALLAFLVGTLLHLVGVASVFATVLGVAAFIFWYIAILYSTVFPFGAVLTFLDAYADYFLGGRYPLLGDLLDRSTPPTTYAYPTHYPPPYHQPPPAGGTTSHPDKIQG